MKALKIHAQDNVAVAIETISQGETILIRDETSGQNISLQAAELIEQGHKIALVPIKTGEDVVKYGFPIGRAASDIAPGGWVHTHNVKTKLDNIVSYTYRPEPAKQRQTAGDKTFQGYRRSCGKVGIRNEIFIIPTVGCVNKNAAIIAQMSQNLYSNPNIDGIYEFSHPYGCSQMGEDQLNTQKILANLVNHPNAGGVLVMGLGCENNNIDEFKKVLGEYDPARVKFLVAQSVEDEIEEGVKIIGELAEYVSKFNREPIPAKELVVGLKCGGSDGFSGITGNPLVGDFSDRLIACGGSAVLTEVPEMFGAETILMNRAADEEVFAKIVRLINDFKEYFLAHKQVVYENPSPGNKKGGITTLEDKSLGCTQKGGESQVVDVLPYAGVVSKKGLNLLSGPGNDMVAATVLAASGCHIVLFTTGRGTPLGTAVPTVKVATNSNLFQSKPNWMDFDAGRLLKESKELVADEFFDYCLQIASGRKTKAEQLGFREITVFKSGVTL